jgi:hypothetical protein
VVPHLTIPKSYTLLENFCKPYRDIPGRENPGRKIRPGVERRHSKKRERVTGSLAFSKFLEISGAAATPDIPALPAQSLRGSMPLRSPYPRFASRRMAFKIRCILEHSSARSMGGIEGHAGRKGGRGSPPFNRFFAKLHKLQIVRDIFRFRGGVERGPNSSRNASALPSKHVAHARLAISVQAVWHPLSLCRNISLISSGQESR